MSQHDGGGGLGAPHPEDHEDQADALRKQFVFWREELCHHLRGWEGTVPAGPDRPLGAGHEPPRPRLPQPQPLHTGRDPTVPPTAPSPVLDSHPCRPHPVRPEGSRGEGGCGVQRQGKCPQGPLPFRQLWSHPAVAGGLQCPQPDLWPRYGFSDKTCARQKS